MIDIFMILLVFFMVTSTYLDLDTVPLLQSENEQVADDEIEATQVRPLLVRIGADGDPVVQGRRLDAEAFEEFLVQRLRETPKLEVLLLPSGAADVQTLVTTMDLATRVGATRLRLVRLVGQQ